MENILFSFCNESIKSYKDLLQKSLSLALNRTPPYYGVISLPTACHWHTDGDIQLLLLKIDRKNGSKEIV